MTDELVKRLRGDWFGYEVSLKAIDAMEEAADRIEALTAQLESTLKDRAKITIKKTAMAKLAATTTTGSMAMTDDLVERLLDWPYQGETMAHEAAARIEQLTAELADAEALIEAQAKDHASNNIRFAEAEQRAKVAEAERDEAWAYMSAAQGDLYDAIMIEAESDRLQREVKDLKKLVCAAYCEGFSDGKDGGWIVGPSNQPWKASDAHRMLKTMEAKP